MNKKAITGIRKTRLSPFMKSVPRLMSHHPTYPTFSLANYTTINTPPPPSSEINWPCMTHPLSSMFWDKGSVDKRTVHLHPTTPQFKKLGCRTNVNPCMSPQALGHYKVKLIITCPLGEGFEQVKWPWFSASGELDARASFVSVTQQEARAHTPFSLPEDESEGAPRPRNGQCTLLSDAVLIKCITTGKASSAWLS